MRGIGAENAPRTHQHAGDDSADGGNQIRDKGQADIPIGREARLLFHFWPVPMAPHLVRMGIAVEFCKQETVLQAAPGAGDPGLGVDEDSIGFHHPRAQERQHREQGTGRVTTRRRDQRSTRQQLPVDFGHAVYRLSKELGGFVLAIPLGVDRFAAQPEIGRDVQGHDRSLAECSHGRGRGRMG